MASSHDSIRLVPFPRVAHQHKSKRSIPPKHAKSLLLLHQTPISPSSSSSIFSLSLTSSLPPTFPPHPHAELDPAAPHHLGTVFPPLTPHLDANLRRATEKKIGCTLTLRNIRQRSRSDKGAPRVSFYSIWADREELQNAAAFPDFRSYLTSDLFMGAHVKRRAQREKKKTIRRIYVSMDSMTNSRQG